MKALFCLLLALASTIPARAESKQYLDCWLNMYNAGGVNRILLKDVNGCKVGKALDTNYFWDIDTETISDGGPVMPVLFEISLCKEKSTLSVFYSETETLKEIKAGAVRAEIEFGKSEGKFTDKSTFSCDLTVKTYESKISK